MHHDNTRHCDRTTLPTAPPLLLAMACSLAIACSLEQPISDPESTTDQAETRVLAEITTPDGAEYTFMEIDSEDLGVIATAPGPMPGTMKDLDPDMSLVELYESVSGQPAPKALVVAEQRVDDRIRNSAMEDEYQPPQFSPGDTTKDDTAEEKLAAGARALTARQFEARYCPSGWDFMYCWPNTSGNPYVQRRAFKLVGVMHAINCHTRYRYRYRKAFRWKTFVDKIAAPGTTQLVSMKTLIRRKKRSQILDNEGCRVHFSAYGDD